MINVLIMDNHGFGAVDYLLVWWILRRHLVEQLHVLSVHLVDAIVITLVHGVRDTGSVALNSGYNL